MWKVALLAADPHLALGIISARDSTLATLSTAACSSVGNSICITSPGLRLVKYCRTFSASLHGMVQCSFSADFLLNYLSIYYLVSSNSLFCLLAGTGLALLHASCQRLPEASIRLLSLPC